MARGAASKTVSGSNSSPENHLTKPSMPERASTEIHDRDSASSDSNQLWFASNAAKVAVFMAELAACKRLMTPVRARAEEN